MIVSDVTNKRVDAASGGEGILFAMEDMAEMKVPVLNKIGRS